MFNRLYIMTHECKPSRREPISPVSNINHSRTFWTRAWPGPLTGSRALAHTQTCLLSFHVCLFGSREDVASFS